MEDALLIIQKEAALMFMGKPLNTLKSLSVFPFWDFRILHSFESSDFKPSPSVDVVLLRVTRKQESLISKSDCDIYLSFIRKVVQDRVGEGIWRELFSKEQISYLLKEYGFIKNRGIGRQVPEVFIKAFELYSKE